MKRDMWTYRERESIGHLEYTANIQTTKLPGDKSWRKLPVVFDYFKKAMQDTIQSQNK